MANDVYQLIVLGQSAGQFFENVLHFKNAATSDPDPVTAATNLIAAFKASAQAELADCMSTDSSLTGHKCRRINNGGSPTIAVPQTAVPGTVTGTSATSATASLLLVPFQRTGKFYTGKVFIPGLSEAELAGNVISGGQRSAVETFAGAMETFTSSPYTWDFVIWSRTVSLPFLPFDFSVSTKVGIQRRRLKPVM